jgi:hypothetical protein
VGFGPCADLAGVVQAVVLVVAELEASELAAAAGRAGMPASDHELLAGPHLDLAPSSRASGALARSCSRAW